MKTLSKKFSIFILLLAFILVVPFVLSACNAPEGSTLYHLTHVSFDVEDSTPASETPTRASEDVQLEYYNISAAYSSVYNSESKLQSLCSRFDGTDKLSDLPNYKISPKPSLYFYSDSTIVNLNIHVKLKMNNKPSSYMDNGYQNKTGRNESVRYSLGTGLNKLELQQDGSYLLKILIFNQAQSYNGNTFYNTTYIMLRFEQA